MLAEAVKLLFLWVYRELATHLINEMSYCIKKRTVCLSFLIISVLYELLLGMSLLAGKGVTLVKIQLKV